MWPFIEKVMEQYGLQAVILLMLLGAIGWVGRWLWRDNRMLSERLQSQAEAHSTAMLQLQAEHAKKLEAAQEPLRLQVLDLQKQLAMIQEKRVDEARAVTERVVTHVQGVDNTMQSLDRTLEVILTLAERGNNHTRG